MTRAEVKEVLEYALESIVLSQKNGFISRNDWLLLSLRAAILSHSADAGDVSYPDALASVSNTRTDTGTVTSAGDALRD